MRAARTLRGPCGLSHTAQPRDPCDGLEPTARDDRVSAARDAALSRAAASHRPQARAAAERAPCPWPTSGVDGAGWTPSETRKTAASAGIFGTIAPAAQPLQLLPIITCLTPKLGASSGVPDEASRGGSPGPELAPVDQSDGCPEPKLRPPLVAKQLCATSDSPCAQHERGANVGPRPPAGHRPMAGGRRPRRARIRRGAPWGSGRGRCPPRWADCGTRRDERRRRRPARPVEGADQPLAWPSHSQRPYSAGRHIYHIYIYACSAALVSRVACRKPHTGV